MIILLNIFISWADFRYLCDSTADFRNISSNRIFTASKFDQKFN